MAAGVIEQNGLGIAFERGSDLGQPALAAATLDLSAVEAVDKALEPIAVIVDRGRRSSANLLQPHHQLQSTTVLLPPLIPRKRNQTCASALVPLAGRAETILA
jgi:hypothetical protein